MSASPTIKKVEKLNLYKKFLREEINSTPSLKTFFPNLQSPKKLKQKELSGVSQIFIPGQENKIYVQTQTNMNKPINLMDFASNKPQNNINEEIFVKENKFDNNRFDINRRLNEEILKNSNLETKLKETEYQRDNLLKTTEELRTKVQEQTKTFIENRNEWEENQNKTIQQLLESEKNLENFKNELDNLKKNFFELKKTNEIIEEEKIDIAKKGEALVQIIGEKDKSLSLKLEEIQSIYRKNDQLNTEIFNLRAQLEKSIDKIRSLEQEIDQNNKLNQEKTRTFQNDYEKLRSENRSFQMENEKFRIENSNLNLQLQEKFSTSENLKTDIYNMKQLLMEKQQKEMNFVLALEKANLEINQLRTLVRKTEINCEELREYNRTLINKISDFASNISNNNQNTQHLLNNLYEIHMDKNLKDNLFLMNKNETSQIQINPAKILPLESRNEREWSSKLDKIPERLEKTDNLKKSQRERDSNSNILAWNSNNPARYEGGKQSLESDLTSMQTKKKNLELELRKIEDSKFKSGASIRRKHEIEAELNVLDTTIPGIRLKIRENH